MKVDIARVLHCSSFTPFIVIFLHAVAGRSSEDVKLLNDMVAILQTFRESSKMSKRLHHVCSTFARVAGEMVVGRNSVLGAYDAEEDTLQLEPALFLGAEVQDIFGASMTGDSPQDMSDLLTSWVGGEAPLMSTLWDSTSTQYED